MTTSMRLGSLLLVVFGCALVAQEETTLDGRPVRILSNDKLALAVRSMGGTMTQILRTDDPDQLNPLQGLGHFVCVDGFGPVSPEERAAGLPGHGEAHRVPWAMSSSEKQDGTLSVTFTATLPIVQETFRRTFRLVDGEAIVYVDSELESLLGFDRPVNWGEHATIGGPFLEPGQTVTEMSAKRASTRSYASEAVDPPDHHNLADDKEFTWPMAPTATGDLIDVRTAPTITPVMDQTTSLMDPSRRLVFVASFHPGTQAVFGYVFRREEYPWTQIWDSYQGEGKRASRGMEFAAQPYDLPRRDVIDANTMFGVPTYRWLPAKSKIRSSFVMFYTKAPDGFTRVDDVVLADGNITIADRASGKTIVLKASRGL
ncbi:MAG: hypothetical protein ABI818_09750 [Acidobacteriota bacterium]